MSNNIANYNTGSSVWRYELNARSRGMENTPLKITEDGSVYCGNRGIIARFRDYTSAKNIIVDAGFIWDTETEGFICDPFQINLPAK